MVVIDNYDSFTYNLCQVRGGRSAKLGGLRPKDPALLVCLCVACMRPANRMRSYTAGPAGKRPSMACVLHATPSTRL